MMSLCKSAIASGLGTSIHGVVVFLRSFYSGNGWIDRSIYGVVVIDGSLYSRFYGIMSNSNGATYTYAQDNITLDNYEEVITNVSGAVRGAITNEQEQTTTNLAMVTAAIARSASLISEMTVIPTTVSLSLVCSVILLS